MPRTASVLFADISDSTRLYLKLGDAAASELVTALLDELAEEVTSEAGQVIDRIGDELMCLFAGPAAAARAAQALQLRCRDFAADRGGETPALHLRIGLHAGEVIERDDRLFGDCVYLAKRLTDAAKADQVLLAEETLGLIDDVGAAFRFVDEVTLKGQERPIRIHELLWDSLETTRPSRPMANDVILSSVLVLEGFGRTQRLTEGKSVKIGRSPPSEVLLPSVDVSRLHASVEGIRGRFALRDFSTNGTYVRDGVVHRDRFVRRDQLFLEGDGLIGFGAPPEEGSIHTIRYAVTDAEETE